MYKQTTRNKMGETGTRTEVQELYFQNRRLLPKTVKLTGICDIYIDQAVIIVTSVVSLMDLYVQIP